MAIAFGDKTSKACETGPDGTLTAPVITGSDTILFLALAINDTSCSYAEYDGVDLGPPILHRSIDYIDTYIWAVLNPGSAKDFHVHVSIQTWVMFAWYYTGVHQTTPYRTPSEAYGYQTHPATVDVTNSQAGDLITGFFGVDDDTLGTIGGGQAERGRQYNATSESGAGIDDEPGASGTVVHSWDANGGDNFNYGWVDWAIPLIPAGGAYTLDVDAGPYLLTGYDVTLSKGGGVVGDSIKLIWTR
jgi:hypothetical protein